MNAVASLGMYDSAGLRPANDRLWRAIAARLRDAGVEDVPAGLDRDRPLEAIWADPKLLLAQTCGYPLVTRFRDRLQYVATPRYRPFGCDGIDHRSRVVVRADDPAETLKDCRGRRLALNSRDSNTGMNLLRALIAPIAGRTPFFSTIAETGSHAASAAVVATGDADVAAIDVVTFAHLAREAPSIASRLRTIAWTDASPGLPFVTTSAMPDRAVSRLRRAIRDAIADEPEAADRLLIEGIEVAGIRRYGKVRRLEDASRQQGYAELR